MRKRLRCSPALPVVVEFLGPADQIADIQGLAGEADGAVREAEAAHAAAARTSMLMRVRWAKMGSRVRSTTPECSARTCHGRIQSLGRSASAGPHELVEAAVDAQGVLVDGRGCGQWVLRSRRCAGHPAGRYATPQLAGAIGRHAASEGLDAVKHLGDHPRSAARRWSPRLRRAACLLAVELEARGRPGHDDVAALLPGRCGTVEMGGDALAGAGAGGDLDRRGRGRRGGSHTRASGGETPRCRAGPRASRATPATPAPSPRRRAGLEVRRTTAGRTRRS